MYEHDLHREIICLAGREILDREVGCYRAQRYGTVALIRGFHKSRLGDDRLSDLSPDDCSSPRLT